jgi:hypothetical protein
MPAENSARSVTGMAFSADGQGKAGLPGAAQNRRLASRLPFADKSIVPEAQKACIIPARR